MKWVLSSVLIIGVLLLSACAAPTTAPEAEAPPTPTTYTLSVSVSPSGGGSVSPPGGKYEPSLQVTLTPTPASGYTFDYWDGAASGSSPTMTITMDSNKSITAHFKVAETPPTPLPSKPMTLNQFLEDNFSICQTSLGPTNFTFDIYENESILYPYDYWIKVKYDSGFFYDLQYSKNITTEMNHRVCEELKAHQEKLARAVIELMPDKKFNGGYFDSWYEYPTIHEGYHAWHYYSWINYTASKTFADYNETKVSEFQWYPLIDDKLTR